MSHRVAQIASLQNPKVIEPIGYRHGAAALSILDVAVVDLARRYPMLTQLGAIKAPVLITLGDRDGVRVEHAVEVYRSIPGSQLAIFLGADHFLFLQHPEILLPTINAFLDAPVAAPKSREKRHSEL